MAKVLVAAVESGVVREGAPETGEISGGCAAQRESPEIGGVES